jgi:hypothetical protein
MSKSYSYCYSLPLEVGSVIRPGNWGRILRTYTPQSSPNHWLLTRELTYELVRIQNFPDKPSRFDSVFVCLSEADLNEFRNTAIRPLDLGYEVELVDPLASCHIGDWSLTNIQNTDNLPLFEERANLYWQGNNIIKQELITLSSIRIIRVLE